jgi:iron complex outermembrane receptor protein
MKKQYFLASSAVVGLLSVAMSMVPSASHAQAVSQSDSSETIETVMVTAEKREESLQDTPVPVTVLSPEALEQNGQDSLQDYYASVPGLNFNAGVGVPGGDRQFFSIRGVTTSAYGTPTVAILVDDVPIGGSTISSQTGFIMPDLDPNDLKQIEVLKGPQGTLYGGDSLAGIIKFETKDPSTDGFEGNAQVLGEGLTDGGGLGYALRAGVNIPLSDELAIRISGFDRSDPGYIDDITTGQTNVNSVDAYGAHISVLWHPIKDLTLKLSALAQNTIGNGTASADTNSTLQPIFGDLKQTELAGTGGYHATLQVYSAALKYDFEGLQLDYISGYSVYKNNGIYDLTQYFSTVVNAAFPGNTASAYPNTFGTNKFTQELRLSSSVENRLDWLVGAFFTGEDSNARVQAVDANNAQTGAYGGTDLTEDYPNTFSEGALFADLTFHITDRLDLELGGRQSWNAQKYQASFTGPGTPIFEGAPSPYTQAVQEINGSAFTYLFTPEFKVSQDLMVYARIASGYQVGGTNLQLPGLYNAPAGFKPSTTVNYELGAKGSLWDGRLTYDGSLYYIDWKNIQVSVTVPYELYDVNGAHAVSKGAELSVHAKPWDGTLISLAASYSDAELTQSLASVAQSITGGGTAYGPAGAALPYGVPVSVYADGEQDVFHLSDYTGFVGGSVTYVDRRYGEFSSDAATPRLVFPAYTTVNLRAGLRYNTWLANIFVNNVGDVRGILGGGTTGQIGNTGGYFAQYVQPRTVGISLSDNF